MYYSTESFREANDEPVHQRLNRQRNMYQDHVATGIWTPFILFRADEGHLPWLISSYNDIESVLRYDYKLHIEDGGSQDTYPKVKRDNFTMLFDLQRLIEEGLVDGHEKALTKPMLLTDVEMKYLARNDRDCNICRSRFGKEQKDEQGVVIYKELPVRTSCGHLFGRHCIIEWLKTYPEHPSCPMCRERFDLSLFRLPQGLQNAEREEPRNTWWLMNMKGISIGDFGPLYDPRWIDHTLNGYLSIRGT